ncbi:MAG TPA: hypothetical protein DIT10_15150 [Chryseobacterium sp.]|nr:hypothetical protein [Chryseobacterium sp.]
MHGTVDVNLYIWDVRLPDGSGINVCNGLKNISSDTLILMMSAHAKTFEIKRHCNPDAFISKPFDIDDLLASVRSLIGPALSFSNKAKQSDRYVLLTVLRNIQLICDIITAWLQ